MRLRSFTSLGLAIALTATLAADATSQMLYGWDGGTGTQFEFTLAPAGACGAPVPAINGCPTPVPGPCGIAPPGFVAPAPAGIIGDIAADHLADVTFVTDGFTIQVYGSRPACGPLGFCPPLDTFVIPPALLAAGFGLITGMGMDETGAMFGAPTLWITDGLLLAAITPLPPCGGAALLFGPCPIPAAPLAGPLTDVTWDPATASLWACDAGGMIHNIVFGPPPLVACFIAASFPVPACGLGLPLQGIAYDTGTPNLITGTAGAMFVTDGFVVESIDVFGAIAAPELYAPLPCSPTPAPLNGLAFSSRGINYGASRVVATIGSFGQSTTPSATFGLEVTGAPAGIPAFLLFNFSFPGPGLFCPGVTAVGTTLWVDPTPPGLVLALPPLPAGCVPIPLPIPAAVPVGLQGYAQFVFTPGGPAVDATEGLAFTVAAP